MELRDACLDQGQRVGAVCRDRPEPYIAALPATAFLIINS